MPLFNRFNFNDEEDPRVGLLSRRFALNSPPILGPGTDIPDPVPVGGMSSPFKLVPGKTVSDGSNEENDLLTPQARATMGDLKTSEEDTGNIPKPGLASKMTSPSDFQTSQIPQARETLEDVKKTSDMGQPKKPGLLSKLFGTKSEPQQMDEYGIPIPTKKEPGMFYKIMNMILPTLISLRGKAGLAPGLLAGMYMNQNAGAKEFQTAQGNYLKQRQDARMAKYQQGVLDTRSKHYQAIEGHQKNMEDISRDRADTYRKRLEGRQNPNSDQDSWVNTPDEYKDKMQKATPEQLQKMMGDPDPTVRGAANFIYKQRFAKKIQNNEDYQ